MVDFSQNTQFIKDKTVRRLTDQQVSVTIERIIVKAGTV